MGYKVAVRAGAVVLVALLLFGLWRLSGWMVGKVEYVGVEESAQIEKKAKQDARAEKLIQDEGGVPTVEKSGGSGKMVSLDFGDALGEASEDFGTLVRPWESKLGRKCQVKRGTVYDAGYSLWDTSCGTFIVSGADGQVRGLIAREKRFSEGDRKKLKGIPGVVDQVYLGREAVSFGELKRGGER